MKIVLEVVLEILDKQAVAKESLVKLTSLVAEGKILFLDRMEERIGNKCELATIAGRFDTREKGGQNYMVLMWPIHHKSMFSWVL